MGKSWVILLALGVAAVHEVHAQGTNVQTVSGFRVPSYDEDGNMTSQMFGDYARILPDGYVEISQLRMEFYKGDGTNRTTDMNVSSPRCLYHRVRGAAVSDQAVRIARTNMVVTGVGFLYLEKAQSLQIMTNAKVVLRNFSKDVYAGGETKKP